MKIKITLKAKELTKRQWKICEAVHLGIDHYFLNGPKDKRPLTESDIEEATALLSALEPNWWVPYQSWMVCKGRKMMED